MDLATKTWELGTLFSTPLDGKNVIIKGFPNNSPIGVEERIRESWDSQLRTKQEALSKQGIITEIKTYDQDPSERPLNALYENGNAIMWPGPVISPFAIQELEGSKENDYRRQAVISVHQSSFPFIAGLKDEKIAALYQTAGMEKPRPALGICTLTKTADQYFALTVRGQRTNMYPGRLHGQGGNPLSAKQTVIEHQKEEMLEEICLTEEDMADCSFDFVGIINDLENLNDKPDLIGYTRVPLETRDIEQRVKKRFLKDRPNDSVGVVFAPTNDADLYDYLTKLTHLQMFTPPVHASLCLYGMRTFGDDWLKAVLERLEDQ